jgi:hypothetical protein
MKYENRFSRNTKNVFPKFKIEIVYYDVVVITA